MISTVCHRYLKFIIKTFFINPEKKHYNIVYILLTLMENDKGCKYLNYNYNTHNKIKNQI